MIRPLRRAHRWVWAALVLALPALLVAALAVRPAATAPAPPLLRLPAEVAFSEPLTGPALELRPTPPVHAPDLVVMLQPVELDPTPPLCLGSWDGVRPMRLRLPRGFTPDQGDVQLWSVALGGPVPVPEALGTLVGIEEQAP